MSSDIKLKETGIVQSVLSRTWKPHPIDKPKVDPKLPSYTFLVRSAEVLKYQIYRLEYSLSKGGGLRSWFKLNLFLAILLLIPALLVVPAITALLSEVASWTVFLKEIMENLTMTLLWGIAFIVIFTGFIFLVGQWYKQTKVGGHKSRRRR